MLFQEVPHGFIGGKYARMTGQCMQESGKKRDAMHDGEKHMACWM